MFIYLARVSVAQQSFVPHSLSAYMWRRASRFLGIGLCFSVPRLPEQFWISRFASGIAFQSLETDSEIEFFVSSTGNFIHFGPHEEVEEQCDRWGHQILWTTSSTFLGSGCLECMIVRLLLVAA